MGSAGTELRAVARRTLEECGATDIRFEDVGYHPRVCFKVGDAWRFHILSRSPGDRRAPYKLRSDLRRMCRELLQTTEAGGMQQQTNTAVAVVEPHVVASDDALNLYEVSAEDDELRGRDIDLAVRLGMKNPKAIRRMIHQHKKKLNDINTVTEMSEVHGGNGTEFSEYYLDRRQATFLAIRSNTPASDDVAMELVEVYDRWRKGTLPQHPAAAASVSTDAAVGVLVQIRDGITSLRNDQSAIMDVMASLETRLQQVEQRAALPAPAPADDAPPADALIKLSHWCELRGIDYGGPSNLGQKAAGRVSAIAKAEGIDRVRQPFTGRWLYPANFLDEHADDIRQWLA